MWIRYHLFLKKKKNIFYVLSFETKKQSFKWETFESLALLKVLLMKQYKLKIQLFCISTFFLKENKRNVAETWKKIQLSFYENVLNESQIKKKVRKKNVGSFVKKEGIMSLCLESSASQEVTSRKKNYEVKIKKIHLW